RGRRRAPRERKRGRDQADGRAHRRAVGGCAAGADPARSFRQGAWSGRPGSNRRPSAPKENRALRDFSGCFRINWLRAVPERPEASASILQTPFELVLNSSSVHKAVREFANSLRNQLPPPLLFGPTDE